MFVALVVKTTQNLRGIQYLEWRFAPIVDTIMQKNNMKYDWSFFTFFSGTKPPSIPKKKNVKAPTRIEDKLHFTFTVHALLRLNQRFESEIRTKEVFIRWKWFTITWPWTGRFLHPQLVRNVLHDVHHNAIRWSLYSEKYNRVVVRGKLWFYAISPDQSIITVMKTLDKWYYKEQDYKCASRKFILQYLWIK